ncbi:unnamed protein product [Moneuplotes crassus]|uniref:Centromere protein J C-terminal domain-containing protein n=1 Tax=Euplotes crassus TaxID=5936 RepID=A0AAD2D2Q0_EUPCR|nr:unnamed protein product [Moneuplotes crassus]
MSEFFFPQPRNGLFEKIQIFNNHHDLRNHVKEKRLKVHSQGQSSHESVFPSLQKNSQYNALDLVKPGVVLSVESSSEDSLLEYYSRESPEAGSHIKDSGLHDYARASSSDSIFNDHYIRSLINDKVKVTQDYVDKVLNNRFQQKNKYVKIPVGENQILGSKYQPLKKKAYEEMNDEDKPLLKDCKFQNPDSSFDREKKISYKKRVKYLPPKKEIITPEIPKLNFQDINHCKGYKAQVRPSMESLPSLSNTLSSKGRKKIRYLEKQLSKNSHSQISNDNSKTNRMVSIMDIENSITANSKEQCSKIDDTKPAELNHNLCQIKIPNRGIKSMKVEAKRKSKAKKKESNSRLKKEANLSNPSFEIDVISGSSNQETQRLKKDMQRRRTHVQNPPDNPNLLGVKGSIHPSSSSHMQGSHSFYSEIDFSRENLWSKKEEAKVKNKSKNTLYEENTGENKNTPEENKDKQKKSTRQIVNERKDEADNNFENDVMKSENNTEIVQIRPTHKRNIASVDKIPLQKQFKPFNELLETQLNRNSSIKKGSASPLNSPSKEASMKSNINAEDIDKNRKPKTNSRRSNNSTIKTPTSNTPELTYRDAIPNLPEGNARVGYQTSPPLLEPSATSSVDKIYVENNTNGSPSKRLSPLDHQYTLPEHPSAAAILKAEEQKYSALLKDAKAFLGQYKASNEKLVKENEKLRYKLKKCKYLIKTQNIKILTLEEQVQRKDLENIRNQVEMEKRVLENTRMMTNGMLTQTEHFRSYYNPVPRDFDDRNFNYMSEAVDHTQYFTPKGSSPSKIDSRHINSASKIRNLKADQDESVPLHISSKFSENSRNRATTHHQTGRTDSKPPVENNPQVQKSLNVKANEKSVEENKSESDIESVKSPEFKLTDDQIEEYKSEQESDSSEANYKITKEFSTLPEKYKGIQEASKRSFYIPQQEVNVIKQKTVERGTEEQENEKQMDQKAQDRLQSTSIRTKPEGVDEDQEFIEHDLTDAVTYTKQKSGVTTKFYTSGKIEKIYKDGTVLCTYKDGKILCTYQDGSKEIVFADGKIKRLTKKE